MCIDMIADDGTIITVYDQIKKQEQEDDNNNNHSLMFFVLMHSNSSSLPHQAFPMMVLPSIFI